MSRNSRQSAVKESAVKESAVKESAVKESAVTIESMTIDTLRKFCRSLPDVTEDIKWGQDLVFSIGGKMFVVVNIEPPNQISFKCTPETFGELVEREGLIPAPYLARAMWVQEQSLGETLERSELEALVRSSYDLVRAKLPKKRRASQKRRAKPRRRTRRG